MNREVATDDDLSDWAMVWQSIVGSGHKVHESICSLGIYPFHVSELEKNKNYNITASRNVLAKHAWSNLSKYKDQIQVSVYNENDVVEYHDWQKLFLIKNDETYYDFKRFLGKPTGLLHFLIDQSWANATEIREIVQLFNSKASEGQSMDSCLTSWLVNGCCPYSDGNYIDINFDGTVRACPYAAKGVLPKRGGSINTLFGLKMLPTQCKYMELFGEINNGKVNNTCIQSYVTNSGDGSRS